MSLQDKIWTPCTIHEVAREYLRAEKQHILAQPGAADEPVLSDDFALIDHPDYTNPSHNHRRWRMLYRLRGPLLAEIPPDTMWYKVSSLTPQEFSELHIMARCGWDDPEGKDENALILVAKRNPKILKTMPPEWAAPILWGHSKAGPFTIIEGNHRLAGYAILENPPALNIPVFVGLSAMPFHYHIFDPPGIIANDLWK